RSSRRRRSASRASCAPQRSSAQCRPCTSVSAAMRRSASVPSGARIGVVGATGAVGTVALALLHERGYENVRAFASARSAGTDLGGIVVEEATPEALSAGDLDVCFFSVGTSASRDLVPEAVRGGAVAVAKAPADRLRKGVPPP